MQGLIVILLVIVVALLGVGVYFTYIKKPAPQRGPEVPLGPVVDMRSAGSKAFVTFELPLSAIGGNEPVPFRYDLEVDPLSEDDILEEFRSKSTAPERRREIADQLRRLGYKVSVEGDGQAAGSGGGPSPEPDDEGVTDIASETDPDVLRGMLNNPFVSPGDREAAAARLEVLLAERGDAPAPPVPPAPVAPPAPEPEPQSSAVPAGPQSDSGEGYVDPDTHVSVPDPHPEVPYEAPAAPAAPAAAFDPLAGIAPLPEPAPVPEPAPAPPVVSAVPASAPVWDAGDGAMVLDFTFTSADMDDDADSVKAIELMSFIAHSFRKRLISPELVWFAQQKLHLKVNDACWDEELRRRASERHHVYDRDPKFASMPLDDFDRHVHEVVAAEERRAREAAAKAASVAEPVAPAAPVASAVVSAPAPESVPEPAPAGSGVKGEGASSPSPGRPVTVLPDGKGGRNDIVWDRLESFLEDF